MVLGKMPRGTTKLVKRIQGLTNAKKSVSEFSNSKRVSFSQLPEAAKFAFLTGRARSMAKSSRLGRLPHDIPQGCLAIYVGVERRRYVISANFLNHPLFKELLKRSEEEFGFEYEGGLNIACEPCLFEHLLWMIVTKDPAARSSSLEELVDMFESNFCSGS